MKFCSLVLKMFKNNSLDLVWSDRTCRAKLGIWSFLVTGLVTGDDQTVEQRENAQAESS